MVSCNVLSRRRKGVEIGRKGKREGDWGERVRDSLLFSPLFW